MNIAPQPAEKEITLDDSKPFVEKQDVAPGDSETPAYTIEGPDNHLIAVDVETPVAPEFRDADGNKLDESTTFVIQKCDKQGNPLGTGIVLSDSLGRYDYENMRVDPDYFRRTQKSLMIDEREIVKVFVDIPENADAGFSAAESRLTIGDDTSDFGKPVGIVDKSDLNGAQAQAVAQASQTNGGN